MIKRSYFVSFKLLGNGETLVTGDFTFDIKSLFKLSAGMLLLQAKLHVNDYLPVHPDGTVTVITSLNKI